MRGTAAKRRALAEVAWVLAKLGTIGFGGPAAHLSLMRQEMVQRRRWLAEQEFLDLIGAASVLPGPTSTQVGILLGRRRAGWSGLIVAGICFISPAMVIVGALAWAYVRWGTTVAGRGVLYGIKPVVIAIVIQALYGMSRVAIRGRALLAVVAIGALCSYFAAVNVLAILLVAGGLTTLVTNGRRLLPVFLVAPSRLGAVSAALSSVRRHHPALMSVLAEFLKLGFVVFGSGYVLLAFLRRDLVGPHGWITLRQLLDAVAVGQFTPGPVFTTATFIGYLVGGFGGAAVATAAIFLPSFLMMAALAPLVPKLRAWHWSASALDGFNVAALGLMAGVTVDLARTGVVDPLTGIVTAGALALLALVRTNSVILLGVGAGIGLVHAYA